MSALWNRIQRGAQILAMVGMFAVFAIFIFGVAMRHLGRPQSWVDEVVTIVAVWLVFFTCAFVLKWRDFIAFDLLFQALPASWQRISLVTACLGFVTVMAYIFPALVDYILFMGVMTTDMVEIRLDYVYSIFLAFLVGMCVRLLILAWHLSFGDHHSALAQLSHSPVAGEVVP